MDNRTSLFFQLSLSCYVEKAQDSIKPYYYFLHSPSKKAGTLFKSILLLYLICFGCYILFTRQPDFFDGEKSPATIHWLKDSSSGSSIPKAVFSDGHRQYAIDARYMLRSLVEGEKLEVIYESDRPDLAAVYTFWGFWLGWGELLATFIIYFILFQIAVSVTKNPSATALIEQLEYKEAPKRKYQE